MDAIRRISGHVPGGKLEWVPALAVLGITFQVSKRPEANRRVSALVRLRHADRERDADERVLKI